MAILTDIMMDDISGLELLQIAKENSIDVIGSFNPYNISCSEFDFYDEMHSKPSCLKKIGNYL